MKKKVFIMLMQSFIAGIIITMLSLFFSTDIIKEASNYSNLSFGFPFKFVIQHSSITAPSEKLPFKIHFGSPLENPTEFIFQNLILSLVTTIAAVFLLGLCWKTIKDRLNRKVK